MIAPKTAPDLIPLDQLCARTGLSAATIRRLKDRQLIPFFQPAGKGGKLLFPPDAIERAAGASGGNTSHNPAPTKPLSGPRPKWERDRFADRRNYDHDQASE